MAGSFFLRLRRVAGRHPVWVFALGYVALCLVALRPTIHGSDGHGNYAYLRSLLFDADLNFRNDYALFDRATGGRFDFGAIPIEESTGRPGNRYGIGSALLWAPFVAPVQVISKWQGRAGTGLEARYVWALGIGSAVWAGLGLAMLLMLCRHIWRPGPAWMALAAALALSPLPVYVFFHTSMSHATAFFAVTGLLGCWTLAFRTHRRGWFIGAGLFAGLAVMVRAQDAAVVIALFALGTGVALGRLVRGDGRAFGRILLNLVLAGVVSLIVFAPQMAVWRVLYGSFFAGPAPYLRYSEFSLLRPVHGWQTLFDSNHGLFYWHPLLAVGVAGLATDVRRRQLAPLILLVALLGAWYIAACWQVWFAGASFGNRFYLSVLAAFAAGWSALGDRLRTRRMQALLWGLIVVGGLWNAGLAVQYGTEMIPRQGPVRFSTLLRNQFTRVPMYLLGSVQPND